MRVKFLISKGGFKRPALKHGREVITKLKPIQSKIQIAENSQADKISSLTNDILLHILSFLPTENAVATSALSKRWRHVWTGIAALDLSDWECGGFLRPKFGRIHYKNLLHVLNALDVACLELVRCHFSSSSSSRIISDCLSCFTDEATHP